MKRTSVSLRPLAALLIGASLVSQAQPALAQTGRADSLLRTSPRMVSAFREVVARPSQSTVRVLCDDKEVALGVIVTPDGHILTKGSELKGKIVCKFRDGTTREARVIGIEPKHDLGLVKVEAKGLTPVEWRDSATASVGNWLATPGADRDPVAVGVVSVATRRPNLREFPQGPPPKAGYLGVQLEESEDGLRVGQVLPNGPAAKAGFEAGDIILLTQGKKVLDRQNFIETIQKMKPGDLVTVKIRRSEDEMDLKVRLGRWPNSFGFNRADFQNRLGSQLSNRRSGFPIVLQHDSVIRPADCGGPLVDLDGKAVGVNIARAGRTESYAIPAEVVQLLLPDLLSGKLAPKDELAGLRSQLRKAELAVQKAEKDLAVARKAGKKEQTEAASRALEQQKKALEELREELGEKEKP